MRRLILCVVATVAMNETAFSKAFHGNESFESEKPTRSCLTADTRAIMDRLQKQFGTVKIVSTCRTGAVIAGSGKPSYHRYGKAVDFSVPRVSKSTVIAWLKRNHMGGIMTYRDMNHIHIDTGPRFLALNRSSKGNTRHARRNNSNKWS